MLLATRLEARTKGLTRYFTGNPCPAGHIAPRLVANFTCEICNRAKKSGWSLANPEKNARLAREWAARNPEKVRAMNVARYAKNRGKEAMRRKERYAADPAAAKENAHRWYAENKGRALETIRQWRRLNREAIVAIGNRRRALKAGTDGPHYTVEDVKSLASVQPCCPDCFRKFGPRLRYTVDHITPLSKGGSNSKRNIELRCRPCNSRKNARDPIDHARALGRLV